ncbi:MAG: hypothetical protein OEV94_04070 [Deltaproteobacteria bacterium]|nr:hypothetical protein [Deltaproteobacteria bacterium]
MNQAKNLLMKKGLTHKSAQNHAQDVMGATVSVGLLYQECLHLAQTLDHPGHRVLAEAAATALEAILDDLRESTALAFLPRSQLKEKP